MSDADRVPAEHRDVTRRFVLGCGVAALTAAADRPPNVGVFFIDDMGCADLSSTHRR